jgi:hypothetical protein
LPVFEEFIGGVKALSLDDYAYIQHLSLQKDGQPLGDYLLWLYNSYLGHLLFESHKAIQEQKKIVDGLSRNYLPPSQNMPSNQLVKMYHSAFAANLTRIGIPVAPPIYHPVRLEVWARGEDKEPFKLMKLVTVWHFGFSPPKVTISIRSSFS